MINKLISQLAKLSILRLALIAIVLLAASQLAGELNSLTDFVGPLIAV